jgi:Ca-activated chloride channel homolog
MKQLVIIFVVIAGVGGGINKIAESNRLKKEAAQAVSDENYEQAINCYRALIDTLGINDEQVLMNMANALYRTNDTTSARRYYNKLALADPENIRSQAYNQLGVINKQSNKLEESLLSFKNALLADPTNEEARYNYELVKKLKQQQDQQQQQQNNQQNDQQGKNQDQQQSESDEEQQQQDQEKQEQEQQQNNGEQEQSEQEQEQEEQQENKEQESQETPPPSLEERLSEMDMSIENARMILEAMRNNEIQYIQQNVRKPTKPRDRNKPDW